MVQGGNTAGALNDAAKEIDNQIKNEPAGLRLRPVIDRYATLQEVLQAVVDGKDIAAVVESNEFANLKDQYPTLREGESLTGGAQTTGGFLLGTNDIGQDVWSRLLWGTRVALIIGFSSSIVSLVIRCTPGIAGWICRRNSRSTDEPADGQHVCFPGFDPGNCHHSSS